MKIRLVHNCLWLSVALMSGTDAMTQTGGNSAIDRLDAFYAAAGSEGFEPAIFLDADAAIHTITYTPDGSTRINAFTPETFAQQMDTLVRLYELRQEPVVVISRYYGSLATAFMSVYTRLVDRQSGDTINIRSLHAAQLVRKQEWMVVSLVIHNEVAGYPLSTDFWPPQLTGNIALGLTDKSSSDTALYDPEKVFMPNEVDIIPEYPGNGKMLNALLEAFNISSSDANGGKSFEVVIEEDGFARLHSTDGFDDQELDQIQSFVNSMLIWYPAVKEEASVKCTLTFYLP